MTSANVLRAISLNLTKYFGNNRKETSFDLSGPNLPLCRFPTRSQRTLIDYQQDSSKPVKHYFSSIDLRKRLTCFRSDKLDEERYASIILKLKDYIKQINREHYRRAILERERVPPWNRFWWKARGLSFRAIYLMSRYENRKTRNMEQIKRSQMNHTKKGYNKYGVKLKHIYGKPPILRMCPHPYISRGEAERIINQAAKLLLITETFEPLAYEFTAFGMKIRNVNTPDLDTVELQKKMDTEVEMYKRLSQTKSKTKSDESLNINDMKEDNREKVAVFKIKKISTTKDSNLDSNGELFKPDEISDDSYNRMLEMEKSLFSKDDRLGGGGLFKRFSHRLSSENLKYKLKSCCTSVKTKDQKSTKKLKKTEVEVDNPLNLQSDCGISKLQSIKKITSKESITTSEEEPMTNLTNSLLPIEEKPADVKDWLKSQTSNQDDDSFYGTKDNLAGQVSNNKCETNDNRSNNIDTTQRFEIKIVTGDRMGSSTNAKIWLYIIGNVRNLRRAVELKKSKTNLRPFRRGNTDIFKLVSSVRLGMIKGIQIGHDSDLPGSDWYLESVSIRDCSSQLNYFFPCWRWLSVRSDDKQTRVNLEYNPQIHEPFIPVKPIATYLDASIQCDDNEEDQMVNFTTFDGKKYQEFMELKPQDQKPENDLSDMVVEFSKLSSSDVTATSLMSVRRGIQTEEHNFGELNEYSDHCTAEVMVMDNSDRSHISPIVKEPDVDLNTNIDLNTNVDLNTNADLISNSDSSGSYYKGGSCTPNPISHYSISDEDS